jgi:thioredoxin 1
MITINNSG